MNLTLLHKQFGTQEKCISYLEKTRWNKKPLCLHCNSKNVKKRAKSIRWHCNACNKDFSVLMGTIFEGTRLPLPKFFEIMFLMNNAKMGISASEIARLVGVKYQTAWFACHKTRCAMIDNELKLEGMVEFDEAYIGSKKKKKSELIENEANLSKMTSKRGRGTNKTPIVGAVEKKGRVYVKIIEKLTGRNLLAMLRDKVDVDSSIVFTDDFRSYKQFDKAVEHITIKHSEGYGKGVKTINTIEGFWSIIKNGIKGSYRSVSKKYLPFYLAEFSYKYNNRHLQKDAFTKLLENAVKDENCLLNYKPKGNPREIVARQRKCKTAMS
ncbi:MAG: IS1595 family transposase [Flavobacteriales bacterium]|nr:IS1595 family transposase [Flavobacteriales bacterium]